jgi:hypothetical protein
MRSKVFLTVFVFIAFLAAESGAQVRQAPPVIEEVPFAIPARPFRPSPVQAAIIKVLADYQIHDLAALGHLSLRGAVVPQRGMLTPDMISAASQTTIRAATHRSGTSFVPLSGGATLLPARTPSGISAKAEIPIDAAYIAADSIDLGDDTTLVLTKDTRRLFLICRSLKVGNNSGISYDRETPASTPTVPPKPAKPGTPGTPDGFSDGRRGSDGSAGSDGARGFGPFIAAPHAEIWVLELHGSPAVDFRGQDGTQGGHGGDGGDGANGGQGSASKSGLVDCKRGPGAGGPGGNGGRGGNGGAGGGGSTGGEFALYAPAPVIASFTAGGFYISVDPGQGGPGGVPGTPGAPGAGGPIGALSSNCGTMGRGSGPSGSQGGAGSQGPSGAAGVKSSDKPVQFSPISASDFAVAWLRPAIRTLTPKTSPPGSALEGEVVSASGLYFVSGDTIQIGGGSQWITCPTTILGDTLLSFVIPATEGGSRSVRLLRQNGTTSNEATITIRAKLTATVPGPRITPGQHARAIGSGFTHGMSVRINNQDAGQATFVDPHTLDFFVVRPKTGVESNPGGEHVKLAVDWNGTTTNTVDVVLDTFLIGELGDSILAGPGLADSNRIVSLVARGLAPRPGNPQVYVKSAAHTGAKIGITPFDNPGLLPVDRQVPTRFPTIREQALALAATPDLDPQFTDLILLDGCANDVGMSNFLDPQKSAAQINAAVEQACHQDMKSLLETIGGAFANAQVIVAGTYMPVAEGSSAVKLVPLLDAFQSVWYQIPKNVLANLTPASRQHIIDNCRTFVNGSNAALAQAVSDINAKIGGTPRFTFVNPGFTAQNAAETGASSLVFGIDLPPDGGLTPQDPPDVAAARATVCKAVGAPRTDVEFCYRASAGHPNQAGAQQYAAKVLQVVK